jgi:Holliday junction DNA helicase RuvB
MKEGDLELLSAIESWEQSHDMEKEYRIGWGWRHVRIWPITLSRLFQQGYLDNVFRSNSFCGYRLNETGKEVLKIHQASQEPTAKEAVQPTRLVIPEDLFEVIEGYEDVKLLTLQALTADKPVHLLFTGIPGSAKTMFLLELSHLGASYILGSQATKAGMADLLFEAQPEILLVDEIDRIGTKDIAILLSLAQTGIVSETKHGKTREARLNTRIFAASNTTRMPPELLSRFMVLHFKPYARENFLMVAGNVLRKREGLEPKLSAYIAERIWALPARFADPRQAIRVARLAKTREEVDRVIEVITKYSDSHE